MFKLLMRALKSPNTKIYNTAKSYLGTSELRGDQHNPKILGFFKAVGHDWVETDETAWCAAFAGAVLEECGYQGTGKLNARSYLDWGTRVELEDAMLGDIVVFWRGRPDSWKGHVAFYDSHDDEYIYVLGGNQSNSVNIAKYPIERLLGVQRLKDD